LNNPLDHTARENGQPGTDQAALFVFDDPFNPERVLPLIVLLMLTAVQFDGAFHPPLWVHLVVWPPVVTLVVGGAVWLMRRYLAPATQGRG